jgi:nickel transport protein
MIMRKILLASVLLATAVSAYAHDAWIEPQGDGFVVNYGHEKLEPYAPAKVKQLTALDAQGAPLAVTRRDSADSVPFTVSGKPSLLLIHFDNGYWSQTTEGMKNIPRTEAPGTTRSVHSVKFGKRVVAWSKVLTRPAGQPLEIVPLSENAPKAGSSLKVRVLRDGKPAAGVTIGTSEKDAEKRELKTDADGIAALPVATGTQGVWVGLKEPLNGDPGADTYSLSAHLRYNVP